jgi:hypothetical protein
MKAGGMCANMRCATGCCANKSCCRVTEEQKAPQAPAPAPQSTHLQLATLGLRAYTILFTPPAREPAFVISDESAVAHTLTPRAVSCIRLI